MDLTISQDFLKVTYTAGCDGDHAAFGGKFDPRNKELQRFSVRILRLRKTGFQSIGAIFDETGKFPMNKAGILGRVDSWCITVKNTTLFLRGEEKTKLTENIKEGTVISVVLNVHRNLLTFEINGDEVHSEVEIQLKKKELQCLKPFIKLCYLGDALEIVDY